MMKADILSAQLHSHEIQQGTGWRIVGIDKLSKKFVRNIFPVIRAIQKNAPTPTSFNIIDGSDAIKIVWDLEREGNSICFYAYNLAGEIYYSVGIYEDNTFQELCVFEQ